MRALTLVTLAVLALAAAGCGGGQSSSQTPLELVSQATSKTAKADSAHVAMTVTGTAGPLGSFTISADGVSDNATHSAKMSLDLSSIAKIAGAGAGNASDWQGDIVVDGSNANDVVEYMRLPVFAKLIPGAKPWLKLDVSKLAKEHGVDFSQLLQAAGSQDPTQALQALQAIGDVRKGGDAQVGGVDTTEYSGTIDPKKIAAVFGSGALGKVVDQMGTKPIPVHVWIDSDGYVRKLVEKMSVQTAEVSITALLSDFGTQVDVTPPPADQTTDLAALLKKS